jgi:two-component system response regulator YesN
MMNRILIVDDDALSRDKLRSLIDFKKCGYMIVGEAKSGREAIGLIEKLKPDVIITDIVMQNINGIELIEFIQKNYPDVVVIALSAYDDYCYVRDGLKLGAKDYLLKHTLTSESLLKILDNTRKTKCFTDENQKEYYAQRKDFLRSLLLAKQDVIEELYNKMEKYKLNPNSGVICIAFSYKLTSKRKNTKNKSFFSKTVYNILEGIISGSNRVELIRIDDDIGVLLFEFIDLVSMKSIQNEINKYLQIIQRKIALLLNGVMYFGVSDLYFGEKKYSDAYSKAVENLKMKFFYPKNYIFRSGKTRDNTPIQLNNEEKLRIQNSIIQGNLAQYSEQINTIFEEIKNRNSQFICIQIFCFALLKTLDEIIHKNGIDITQLYDINQLPFIQKEIECDIEEIRLFFMSIGKKAAELFNQKLIMTSYSDATKGALLYIQKHYQDNISLKDVAKRLSFNASYLSRVFKEDTGINLVHYLNKYRLDRAFLNRSLILPAPTPTYTCTKSEPETA